MNALKSKTFKLLFHIKLINLKNAMGFMCSLKDLDLLIKWYDLELFRGPESASNAFLKHIVSHEAHRFALDLYSLNKQEENLLQERLPLLKSNLPADIDRRTKLESNIEEIRTSTQKIREKLVPLVTTEIESRILKTSLWLNLISIVVAVYAVYFSCVE